jgi:quercetin dioxygenase-like cupin family protein
MEAGGMYFHNENEVERREMLPGVEARLVWGEKIMMGIIDIAPGAVVPMHSHPHEQCGRVLKGGAWFTVGGERRLLTEGDHYVVPGNVEHHVEATSDGCQALDIWSPIREEYISGDVQFFKR